MKHPFFLLAVLACLGAGCSATITPTPRPPGPGPSPSPVACTADAKQCPDGSYVGRTGPNCEFVCPTGPATEGRNCTGAADRTCGSGYECIQECGPPVARDTDPEPGYSCHAAGQPRMCPICLASATMIATPKGDVNVKDIQVGMMVWTMSRDGNRVAMPVLKASKTSVPVSHRIVHLKLKDGREAWISPGHPTADGRLIGTLQKGDRFDGSIVLAAELVPYGDLATHDLLPSGETGVYWADGILVGSTLY